MGKIALFYTGHLSNGAMFEYAKKMADVLNNYPEVKAKLGPLGTAMLADLADYDHKVKVMQKSEHSSKIVVGDRYRGTQFVAYRRVLSAFQLSPVDAEKAAANRLVIHADSHNIDVYGKLETESGMLDNLLGDLETTFAADITTLGINSIVNAIKTGNDMVAEGIVDRHHETTAKVTGETAASRNRLAASITAVFNGVNTLSAIEGETIYAAFIAEANDYNKYYKNHHTGQDAENGHQEAPEPTVPPNNGGNNGGSDKPPNPEE